jgi:HEAT repeat protein
MMDEQLDLFHGVASSAAALQARPAEPLAIDPATLGDEELVGGLADLRIADCLARIREIGRRRPRAGIAALEALCLKHAGFGRARMIPEQAAAVEAMIAIGGSEAATAISRLIARRAMEGPGLNLALCAAACLGSSLQEEIVGEHLRNDDPGIRATAARCVRAWPRLAPVLIELLDDLHGEIRIAAACALGRMGCREGRALLTRMLREDPTTDVMAACAGIGDEEIVVLLGRIGTSRPDLSRAAMAALENVDHPTADKVLEGLHRLLGAP